MMNDGQGLENGNCGREKSNWTGTGLVVPRSLFIEPKKRDEFARTSVCVLVAHEEYAELPTIFISYLE